MQAVRKADYWKNQAPGGHYVNRNRAIFSPWASN